MKNIILLITFFLGAMIFTHAQIPPQAFNYSAVARNAEGNPIASSTIGLQITILKTSTTGTEVYKENHSVSTDAYGLFNLIIGAGAVQSGNMSTINWGDDNYFVKVGMDAAGGSNFLTMGTTQLLSVPYALHAKTAESVVNGGGFTHYIGEPYGGGVVFHVYRGADGNEHGLIVSLTDLGLAPWGLEGTDVPNCENKWNGQANTNAILNAGCLPTDAAGLCAAYNGGGYSDWYLPSVYELKMLWVNLLDVNRVLFQTANATEVYPPYSDWQVIRYWSSTEDCSSCFGMGENGLSGAWYFNFATEGAYFGDSKSVTHNVRAIRAF